MFFTSLILINLLTFSLLSAEATKQNIGSESTSQLTEWEKSIGDIVAFASLISLILFIIFFLIVGIIDGLDYLRSRPGTSPESKTQLTAAAIVTLSTTAEIEANKKKEHEEWKKEQDKSALFAGFSLTALAFILNIETSYMLYRTIELFAAAFILQLISFLLFRLKVNRGIEYYGTVTQFAGFLALLNGFFVFTLEKTHFSGIIILLFSISYIVFFIIIGLNMKTYETDMYNFKMKV